MKKIVFTINEIFLKDKPTSEINPNQYIKNLLELWDDNHSLYICKPMIVLNSITETIEWNKINPEKMFQSQQYKTFFTTDCEEQLRYILNQLKMVKFKNTQDNNLIIIEKYYHNDYPYFIVRGIIGFDSNGIYIVFNPTFENAIPKNIEEKVKRFSGLTTSSAYQKVI